MMMYSEKQGDLIAAALNGEFDVIAHGCNCFGKQRSGIAAQMAKHFGTNEFPMEISDKPFPINKLGCIDWDTEIISGEPLTVINCYTQYEYGTRKVNTDYEAITLCMRKINIVFKGKSIGLPKIGCGLAGGDWSIVSRIIQSELKDMKSVTVMYL